MMLRKGEHMEAKKEIPVGVKNSKDLIDYNYYFVDKSLLLHDLIHRFGKVTLFTRPIRFGKTLNMIMIRYFFEKSEEDHSYLFDNLAISKTGDKYLKHQGQYPVISITLKDIERADYDATFYAFKNLIAAEFDRHSELMDSPKLKHWKKVRFESIYNDTASDNAYEDALKLLSECLYEVYGKKVIILIDEYDVLLQNAYFKGFYEQMVGLIRSVFSNALKTNNALAFGVLTGCLRISKESIFTGLNNLDVYAVTDTKFADAYGFTEGEVKAMAEYYCLEDRFDEIKKWYDGYLFGDTEIVA